MSTYIRYPSESGGSGTITNINGATGPSINILPGSGIDVTTVGNNITIDNTGSSPTGSPNTFAGFDNSGDLESIPGMNIDPLTGGLNESIDNLPNNLSEDQNLNTLLMNVNPLQDSLGDNRSNTNIQLNVDNGNSGFSTGNVTDLSLSVFQVNTGNSARVTNLNMYNQIGNGTDPTTVGGIGYAFAFGDYNDNATLDGSIQGYIFQPHVHSGALSSGAFTVTSFADFSNIEIPVGSYTSVQLSPSISEVKDNQNYVGIGINPTVSLFTGNANFQGLTIGGSLPQMSDDGGYYGILINTNIGASTNTITGINVATQISSGDANFVGLNISPSIGAALGDIRGIRIGIASVSTTDPQGVVGLESDARLQINSQTTLQPTQTFQIGSRISNLFHIPSGSPVTGTDSLGINVAGDLWAEDDIADGPIGIGFNSVGFIASIAVDAGKTVDSVTVFLPASSLPDPGVPTGGTVTDYHMIRTFAPLNQGGSLTIDNLYGLKIDDKFGAFHSSGTNAWGIYVEDPLLQNHFGGLVDMGILQLNGSTSGVLSHVAAAVTTDHTLTWPAAQSSGVLTNNGSGVLSWAASGGANTSLSNLTSTDINQTLQTANSAGITNDLNIKTGNSSGSDSGFINISTGTASGVGGDINITANNGGSIILNPTSGNIGVSLKNIVNMADPISPRDAATKSYVDANSGSPKIAMFNQTEASSTGGGVFPTGSWETRVINTTVLSQSWAMLSGNQITLSPGVYVFESSAPAFFVSSHQSKLYNVSAAADSIIGSSEYASGATAGTSSQTRSRISGVVTVAGPSDEVFEVQHQCASGGVRGDAFGSATGFGVDEVYTQVQITRIG